MRDARLKPSALVGAAALLLAFGVASRAQAASPPAITGLCASCHGANGISSNPNFPNIAGQKEAYIAYAIHQYQTHQRLGAQASIMAGVASGLSDSDIKAVAAYFASLNAQ
jgi:cytochrome c553